MVRIARVVVPEFPHHVVQRGNRRQEVFFSESDYGRYLELLSKHSQKYGIDILAFCLMTNHAHLIAVPRAEGSLAKAIGETHRNYTRHVNFREKWRGYLWQGRFSSYVLDERYLLSATRYILQNPVKAKIVKNPWDYRWSSARHHMKIEHNPIVKDELLAGLIVDWSEFLNAKPEEEDVKLFQLHERTGRPLGDEAFTDKMGSILRRDLKKKRAGRRKVGK